MAKVFKLKHVTASEAAVLDAVRMALRYHPLVEHVWRVNSGSTIVGDGAAKRLVRFHDIGVSYIDDRGKVKVGGCADLIGILRDGRWLAVEVKRKGEKPTALQIEFLQTIRNCGGVAGWVDDASQIAELLGGKATL